MDVLGEVLDLVPVLLDHFWVLAFVLGGEFGDVVDLGVVQDARLDLAGCKGLVAVVPALLEVGTVFELFVGRKLEDFLAQTELAVDFFLVQAKLVKTVNHCFHSNTRHI